MPLREELMKLVRKTIDVLSAFIVFLIVVGILFIVIDSYVQISHSYNALVVILGNLYWSLFSATLFGLVSVYPKYIDKKQNVISNYHSWLIDMLYRVSSRHNLLKILLSPDLIDRLRWYKKTPQLLENLKVGLRGISPFSSNIEVGQYTAVFPGHDLLWDESVYCSKMSLARHIELTRNVLIAYNEYLIQRLGQNPELMDKQFLKFIDCVDECAEQAQQTIQVLKKSLEFIGQLNNSSQNNLKHEFDSVAQETNVESIDELLPNEVDVEEMARLKKESLRTITNENVYSVIDAIQELLTRYGNELAPQEKDEYGFKLGELCFRIKEYEMCRGALEAIADYRLSKYEALRYLSLAHYELGDLSKASRAISQYLCQSGSLESQSWLFWLKVCSKRKMFSHAAERAGILSRWYPNNEIIWAKAIEYLIIDNQLDKAKERFFKARERGLLSYVIDFYLFELLSIASNSVGSDSIKLRKRCVYLKNRVPNFVCNYDFEEIKALLSRETTYLSTKQRQSLTVLLKLLED